MKAVETSQQILEEMLPPPKPGENERRNNRRHALDTSSQVLLVGPPARLVSVTVRDLAVNGIGLITSRQFSPGETFVFTFKRAGQSVMVLAEVRHCRPMRDGSQSVGARFRDAQRIVAGKEILPLAWLNIGIDEAGFVPTTTP